MSFNELPTKLPNKIPINIAPPDFGDEEGKNLINEIRLFLSKRLFKWDDTVKDNFSFDLPPSIFNEQTSIKYNFHEEQDLAYNNPDEKLNSQQLSDIWNYGQFSVNSKIEGFPYVWKLSDSMVKGRENIKKTFYNDLSNSYYYLYALKYRFTTNHYKDFSCSFPSSFYGIYKGLWHICDLLIGLRNGHEAKDTSQIELEIKRKLLLNLMKENPQINPYIYTEEDYQIFKGLTDEFNKIWEKDSIEVENDLYEMYELYNHDQSPGQSNKISSEENIKIKLREERNKLYIEYINKSKIFDDGKKKLLIDYLNALMEFAKIELEYEQNVLKAMREIEEEIKKSHPIKSKIQAWLDESVNKQEAEIKSKLISEKQLKIKKNLEIFEIPFLIWKEKMKFETEFKLQFENEIKIIPKKFIPAKNVIVTINYLSPHHYQIKEKINAENNKKYYLEKSKDYQVTTSSIFWRVKLFFARYYTYTNNVLISYVNSLLNSSFGIRALYEEKVYNDLGINETTGITYPTGESFTYRSVLKNLSNWIKKSREDFENAPDTGFIGKDFGRILNKINNYIFKFGILGSTVLVGYPLAVISKTLLTTATAVTSPVWMLGFLSARSGFNTLIYDSDSRSFSYPILPAVTYSGLYIVIRGVFQLALTSSQCALQPALSLLLATSACLRYTLRCGYDSLIFSLVERKGKIPKSNSEDAWKISGPGLANKKYNSISLQDALTIVHAQLEKEQLYHFQSQVNNLLRESDDIFNNQLTPLFKQVNLTPYHIEDTNCYLYENILQEQIEKRIELFPSVKNVKFTLNELGALKAFAQEYIINYLKKNNMEFIWKRYDLPEDAFKRLTEQILCRAFDNYILESLSQADFRIELKKNFNNSYDELKNQLFDVEKIEKFRLVEKKDRRRDINVVLPDLITMESIANPNKPFYLDFNILSKEQKKLIFGADYEDNK